MRVVVIAPDMLRCGHHWSSFLQRIQREAEDLVRFKFYLPCENVYVSFSESMHDGEKREKLKYAVNVQNLLRFFCCCNSYNIHYTILLNLVKILMNVQLFQIDESQDRLREVDQHTTCRQTAPYILRFLERVVPGVLVTKLNSIF